MPLDKITQNVKPNQPLFAKLANDTKQCATNDHLAVGLTKSLKILATKIKTKSN